jgi:hypothetical protein
MDNPEPDRKPPEPVLSADEEQAIFDSLLDLLQPDMGAGDEEPDAFGL